MALVAQAAPAGAPPADAVVPQDLPDESSPAAPETPPENASAAEEAYPDAPAALDPNFRIQLPGFEGPLDLLLYLIRKHELDIEDLPIAFVTERYVAYLSLFEQLNLDVASEYLVMAATLAHIKSKALLPVPPVDEEEGAEDELDPRAELIRRLLEYQKYKQVAERLGSRGIAGRDVFPRGAPAPTLDGPRPLAETSVFKLIDAFQKIVERKKGELSFEIDAERITIQERMGQITERLRAGGGRQPFETLFDGYATTYDLVVTFLALLEMAKMRIMRLYQSASGDMVYVEVRVLEGTEDAPEDARAPEETP